MWIIIKSLLNSSKQWFKGNTVNFVLVLNKWDLNVWYDFHNRLSFSFYGIQLFKLFFFKIPTYFKTAIQLLTHHRHHWDKLVSFSLWILYFYSWKNRITKSRLNWMTEYCIVLFFERLHFYRPNFAGITWINEKGDKGMIVWDETTIKVAKEWIRASRISCKPIKIVCCWVSYFE